jgi:hypothetical protein
MWNGNKRQIRHEPRELYEGPGFQLAIGFHDYDKGSDRKAPTVELAFDHFFGMLERQFDVRPKKIEYDNELFTQYSSLPRK